MGRERPEILFDASGVPQFLHNGVNTESEALPPKPIGDHLAQQAVAKSTPWVWACILACTASNDAWGGLMH